MNGGRLHAPRAVLQRGLGRVRSDPLVRGSSTLFLFTAATSATLYAFHVALGRALTPAEFGVASAFFAVLTLATRPFEVLETVGAHYAAKLADDPARRAATLRRLQMTAVGAGAALLAGFTLGAQSIAAQLDAHWRLTFVVGATAAVVPWYALQRGIVQGHESFRLYGVARLVTAIVRLIVGLGLVLLGAGVLGALLGPLVGFGSAIVLMIMLGPRVVRSGASPPAPGLLRFTLPALAAYLGFAGLVSVSLVVVKAQMGSHEAGIYAAAFVLAEAALFLPAAVGLVLLPMLSRRGSSDRGLLARAVLLTLVPSLALVGLFAVAPRSIVGFVLGPAYLEAAPILPILGLAMAFAGVASVVMQYKTALRSFAFPIALLGFAALEAGVVAIWHADLFQVAVLVAVVCGLAAVTGVGLGLRRPTPRGSDAMAFEP